MVSSGCGLHAATLCFRQCLAYYSNVYMESFDTPVTTVVQMPSRLSLWSMVFNIVTSKSCFITQQDTSLKPAVHRRRRYPLELGVPYQVLPPWPPLYTPGGSRMIRRPIGRNYELWVLRIAIVSDKGTILPLFLGSHLAPAMVPLIQFDVCPPAKG